MDPIGNGHVILVVEDDDDLRAVLARVLTLAGYQVVPVASAEAALATFARPGKPCVVLTDVDLPGISGFELRRRMREQPSSPRIPVLFMTGGVLADRSAAETGVVLHKPISLRRLCASLERPLWGACCHAPAAVCLTRPTEHVA